MCNGCPHLNTPLCTEQHYHTVATVQPKGRILFLQGERALQMDVQEGARLQLQAFEAINEVVRSASPDTLPLVSQLIPALLDKLSSTIRMQASSTEAKEHQSELQVCTCMALGY